MSAAVVLWPAGGSTMSIELTIAEADTQTFRVRKTMARDPNEPCDKTLERMRMLLLPSPSSSSSSPSSSRVNKKKRFSREELLTALPSASVLGHDGLPLDTSLPNCEVWSLAKQLVLDTHVLPVSYNVPVVKIVTIPPTVTVGVPAVCGKLSTMFCTEDDLFFEWRCEGPLGLVSTERVFTPELAHAHQTLTFRCRPRHPEEALWAEVTLPAVRLPLLAAVPLNRWEYTKARAHETNPSGFRVVSYNILHDTFCTSNYAKTKLYPFAKEEVLDLDYRKGAIVAELQSYNSDIILLQECGEDVYYSYYSHVLKAMGFSSAYFGKFGMSREGSVIAYQVERFEVAFVDSILLGYKTLREYHQDLADEVDKYPHAKEVLENMTAVGAITVLRDRLDANRILVVGCTHLFFHPHGCHIRALQSYMMASALQRIKDRLKKATAHEGTRVHVLLGGDFNFSRAGGAYELLTKGSICARRDCWDKGFAFWWGCEDEEGKEFGNDEEESASREELVEVIESAVAMENNPTPATTNRSSLEMQSPHLPANHNRKGPTSVFRASLSLPGELHFEDTHVNEPTLKYTNFTLSFKAIIDHIFIGNCISDHGEKLIVTRTIPLPSEEELTREVAIPNATLASDHVALVVDLAFYRA